MSRVIAFDISTYAFDWAIVINGQWVLTHGTLSAPPKLSTEERLLHLADQVELLLLAATIDADYCVVEEANYVRNAVTQRSLVTAIAYIHAAAHRAKLEFSTVHNSTWKAALGLKLFGKERAEQKALVREAIIRRFPTLSTASQDQCDAIGVGLYASTDREPVAPKPKRRKKLVPA